ncbi:hypothetical protein V1292_001934 [Bradyrhizobium sp. AZCC 1719]|uniref:DUF4760 domain-containing protein n=1 Tax=Bradyrhizobium sp. AZCC 1719 TaxID=3117028 RepID=UPI002FF0EB56
MDISRKAIIWTLLAVVALWAATPAIIGLLPLKDWAERGQVGDLFGSINALFSGLAFAGVIFAILLQRQELALQRQELRDTRAEMKRTADAQDAAQQALNKTIWAQSFKVAVDIVDNVDIVRDREFIAQQSVAFQAPRWQWTQQQLDTSERVTRSFETVGTMIRRGLLPLEYFDGWCIAITRSWDILESGIRKQREERNDNFIGRDFEWLVGQMRPFLPEK